MPTSIYAAELAISEADSGEGNDLSDVAATAPCALSFEEVFHPDENELWWSDEALHCFGMRRSEVNPTEFHLFFERFIKYWPRRTFHVKRSYKKGFLEMKRKRDGRSLPLFDSLAMEYAERHLCPDYWSRWKSRQEDKLIESLPIWVGLHMPKKTTVDAIDFDAKEYLVGEYDLCGEIRPLVHLPLEHFKTLKRLYDAFPNRMWCISSETLGIHAWRVHEHPVDSLFLHGQNKSVLANIGLPSIESHPMPGRCFRRPFGHDYRIITPDEVLSGWLGQVHYSEFDRRTPTFPQIVDALIEAMQTQQEFWNQATERSPRMGKKHKVPGSVPNLTEIRNWLADGCPLNSVVMVPAPPVPAIAKPEADMLAAEVFFESVGEKSPYVGPPQEILPYVPSQPGNSSLADYRNGQWPKALREWAKNGLSEPDSVGTVLCEMAKWLYWIELYGVSYSDRTERIVSLLTTFVMKKHNGCVSRMVIGKESDVHDQVARCVESAVRLQQKDKERSLNLFASIRKKLEEGQYKHPLRLAPLLTENQDEERTIPLSLPSTSIMCIRFAPDDLPRSISERIQEKAGRKKVLPFAAKLISYLAEKDGSSYIARPTYFDILGHKNPNRISEYLTILEKAGVIQRGESYSVGRNGKKCSLLPWVLEELGIHAVTEAPESPPEASSKTTPLKPPSEGLQLNESIWELVEPIWVGVGGGLGIG